MGQRPQNFDGGGSERVRGNAHQVLERYLALARDASSAGDRVAAENYLQHAEHYYRVINAANEGGRRQGQRPDGNGATVNGNRPEGDSSAQGRTEAGGAQGEDEAD